MADKPKTLASAAGIPVGDNQNALTAGERGPLPIQDWQLFEKHAQFNRERDGVMRADGNYGDTVNYEPNSFSGPADRYDHRKGNDDYTQAGDLFRLLKPERKNRLIQNIVGAMKTVPKEIQERQIAHLYQADPVYGEGVAKGLDLPLPKMS